MPKLPVVAVVVLVYDFGKTPLDFLLKFPYNISIVNTHGNTHDRSLR
jgi:hypothetical protein